MNFLEWVVMWHNVRIVCSPGDEDEFLQMLERADAPRMGIVPGDTGNRFLPGMTMVFTSEDMKACVGVCGSGRPEMEN